MAYAEAAGLPAIYGLYATIVPLLAYAVVGPSRILVLGPDSSLAPMIAAAVLPLAAGDPSAPSTVAAVLAILAGAVRVVAGLLRLGFITDLLAKPIRYGYMNGIALTVLVSQLPKMFGFSVESDGLVARIGGFVSGVASGADQLRPRWRWAAARWWSSCSSSGSCASRACCSPWAARPSRSGGSTFPRASASRCWARCRGACRPSPSRSLSLNEIGALCRGRRRDRGGLVRRHQRPLARVFRQAPDLRRSQPGDDRPGGGQPGRRVLPGLPDQQQLLAHAGGRGERLEDPADRSGGRAGDRRCCWSLRRRCSRPAPRRAGRGRDRLRHRPVRVRRPAPPVPHPALGVLAVASPRSSAWRSSGRCRG